MPGLLAPKPTLPYSQSPFLCSSGHFLKHVSHVPSERPKNRALPDGLASGQGCAVMVEMHWRGGTQSSAPPHTHTKGLKLGYSSGLSSWKHSFAVSGPELTSLRLLMCSLERSLGCQGNHVNKMVVPLLTWHPLFSEAFFVWFPFGGCLDGWRF